MLTNIEISGTTLFENNIANYGAAFHLFYSTISIVGKISVANNTANLGAIGIIHSTAVIRANVIFVGILDLSSCIVEKLVLSLSTMEKQFLPTTINLTKQEFLCKNL